VQFAIVFAVFFPAVMLIEQHWCVWHLEGKLARLRAASLVNTAAAFGIPRACTRERDDGRRAMADFPFVCRTGGYRYASGAGWNPGSATYTPAPSFRRTGPAPWTLAFLLSHRWMLSVICAGSRADPVVLGGRADGYRSCLAILE
jgi:hypothetical protein